MYHNARCENVLARLGWISLSGYLGCKLKVMANGTEKSGGSEFVWGLEACHWGGGLNS